MKNSIDDEIVNALGNPQYDPEQIEKALIEKMDEVKANGGNPGSFIAILNLLPSITRYAKNQYDKVSDVWTDTDK